MPFTKKGSPVGHPKGVPCAELAPKVTEGLLRESDTERKRFQFCTPPLPSGDFPSPKGEAFAIIFPKPLDNFHIILYNKDKEKKL